MAPPPRPSPTLGCFRRRPWRGHGGCARPRRARRRSSQLPSCAASWHRKSGRPLPRFGSRATAAGAATGPTASRRLPGRTPRRCTSTCRTRPASRSWRSPRSRSESTSNAWAAPTLPPVASWCLTAAEQASLATQPTVGGVAYLELFTRKESYLKGVGVGLVRDPREVTFEPGGGRWSVVLDHGRPTPWRSCSLGLKRQWIGALAVASPQATVRWQTWPASAPPASPRRRS